MREYTRGLAEVGARVYGIGDTPPHELGPLRGFLADYLQVPRIMDEDDVIARAAAWLGGRNVDRVLTNWEPLVVLAARMRQRWEIPGLDPDTARAFRDKQLMKERVAAAGLRVPRAARARSVAEARAAAEEIGFPLVAKPIAGAGSADTHRVDDAAALDRVLTALGHVPEISVEEYIEGEEYTFDAISVRGETVIENVAYYLPKPIVGRNEEWISPMTITVRDMDRPELAPGIALGHDVLAAMGMHDGFSHMEWFLTPKGEAVFGEIACRPPGAHLVDQINFTCDTDLFVEWARAMVWGHFEGKTERKYNCAMICKRAVGQGRIQRIEGLDDFRRRFGETIVVESFLPLGAPRRNWRQTLLGDGYVTIRHPEWNETLRIALAAANDIKLYAS
jgi:biotin carboxylase